MGKQWVALAAGVALGVAFAVVGVVLATGEREVTEVAEKGAASARPLSLQKGAEVELLLLQPLHSGDAEVGEVATAVVTEGVRNAHGEVVIPAGSVATLEVVRSREASVMASMVNQPARLEVRFLDVAVKGARVPLTADADDPAATLELTRDAASRSEASAALKGLWEHPETQRFLSDLADRLNGENLGEDFDDPDSRRILRDVAQELGLSAADRAGADGQSIGAMLAATERVSRGQFESMDAAEALLAIQAVAELARVASGVDRGLRGAIKGRNIKLPIGTRLTAYIAKDTEI